MADTATSLRARFQQKSTERMHKIDKLRKVEWKLDREWSMTLVDTCRDLRAGLTKLERDLVMIHSQIKFAELHAEMVTEGVNVEEDACDIIVRVMAET